MSYREIVELERFRVYKEEAAKVEQPSSMPTSQVEVAMERAISKAEQTLIKKHRAELDRMTKIFFNAGRYAAGHSSFSFLCFSYPPYGLWQGNAMH